MRVVVDTNILVSALLTPEGNSAKILDCILNGMVVLCYDSRVITEYKEVLRRPKFNFDPKSVKVLIDFILHVGLSIIPKPVDKCFKDEEDKKFYEVAISAEAYLVTGNLKHFPEELFIMTPHGFLKRIFFKNS